MLEPRALLYPVQRIRNRRVDGSTFSQSVIALVWEKAEKDFGFSYFRRDVCGRTMSMMEFGQESQFGWEIDHIVPVSCGGTDEPSNLQALHWENNAAKGELYPVWGISENGAVRGAR